MNLCTSLLVIELAKNWVTFVLTQVSDVAINFYQR